VAYQVLLAEQVSTQLRGAPAHLQGYIDGTLRSYGSTRPQPAPAFTVIQGEDYRTVLFADGRGFLFYEVFEDRQVVVLDRLVWLE